MIDWKSRVKNKLFWIAFIPAILLLIQNVGAVFGFTFNFADLQEKLLEVINAVFGLLVIMGVVIDTSTPGLSDEKKGE